MNEHDPKAKETKALDEEVAVKSYYLLNEIELHLQYGGKSEENSEEAIADGAMHILDINNAEIEEEVARLEKYEKIADSYMSFLHKSDQRFSSKTFKGRLFDSLMGGAGEEETDIEIKKEEVFFNETQAICEVFDDREVDDIETINKHKILCATDIYLRHDHKDVAEKLVGMIDYVCPYGDDVSSYDEMELFARDMHVNGRNAHRDYMYDTARAYAEHDKDLLAETEKMLHGIVGRYDERNQYLAKNLVGLAVDLSALDWEIQHGKDLPADVLEKRAKETDTKLVSDFDKACENIIFSKREMDEVRDVIFHIQNWVETYFKSYLEQLED